MWNRICLLAVAVLGFSSAPTEATLWVVPDSLHFGRTRVGEAVVDTVHLGNPNAFDLLVVPEGLPVEPFTLVEAPFSSAPVTLAPGDSLVLVVRYGPVDTGRAISGLVLRTGELVTEVRLEGHGVREVVVINEILADPPGGEDGDANGDGTRSSSADEFVELLNTGMRPVDLSGVHLSDRGTTPGARFVFPAGTSIDPGERIVLFGGGNPFGVPGQVFVDDGKIGKGLANGGDAVYLIDPQGPDTLAAATYGPEGGRNESLVRFPEGTGGLVRHGTLPGKGRYSPGTDRATLSRIELLPTDPELTVGSSAALMALGHFPGGGTVTIEPTVVHWVSDEPSVVSIDSGGVLSALTPGTAEVRGHLGNIVSERVRVRAMAAHIDSLLLLPVDTTVVLGDSASFTPLAWSAFTPVLPTQIVWASADPTVAGVDVDGRVTTNAPGTTLITAFEDSLASSSVLRVAREGDLNVNGEHDIADAVRVAHIIIQEPPPPSVFELRASDLNADGDIDVLDLTSLIIRVMGGEIGGSKTAPAGIATWEQHGTILTVVSPPARGVVAVELAGRASVASLSAGVAVLAEAGLDRTVVAVYGAPTLPDTIRISILSETGAFAVHAVALRDAAGRLAAVVPLNAVAGRSLRSFPNPFNATTSLTFYLHDRMAVRLTVFSVLGQEVAELLSEVRDPGAHTVTWAGTDRAGRSVSAGVYLAALVSETTRDIVKLALVE